ncbi:hypothetical protein HQO42_14780 [Rhodococcus fascians]|nr:hypothetical protein [Rhodococcus fascians]MBY4237720.1 hypothetical protein [Rhodococcus fascians]MBY4253923.1 hypothetical protein [Rhodococcus fascians]MBY4269206.1 hypothetical protein [Rhodococcus fascians]
MNVVFGVWEWVGLVMFLAGATAALASFTRADDSLRRLGNYGFAVSWIGMCVLIFAFVARGA